MKKKKKKTEGNYKKAMEEREKIRKSKIEDYEKKQKQLEELQKQKESEKEKNLITHMQTMKKKFWIKK